MLGEMIGFKSGVALSHEKLVEFLRAEKRFKHHVDPPSVNVGMEFSELEDIVEYLLFKLGRLEKRNNPPLVEKLGKKIKTDPAFNTMWLEIREKFVQMCSKSLETPEVKSVDPSELFEFASNKFGVEGIDLAYKMLEDMNVQMYKSAMGKVRLVEWKDVIELKHLFETENLLPQYGTFFDQRFIDYLHRNFSDIRKMNWRQFERLTAEYFDNEGFTVQLGPGRNDGGVDIRIWPRGEHETKPPLILIQCKRTKDDVELEVLTSLYAHVDWEHKKSGEHTTTGLIVTTARLAPGAEEVRVARSYPITVAEQENLRKWISQLRQPGIS